MPTQEYYRQSKSERREKKRQLQLYGIVSMVLAASLIVVVGYLYLQISVRNSQHAELENLGQVVAAQKEELAVLRIINPYQYKYAQILSSNEAKQDMLPGWVTRVYPAPEKIGELEGTMDMGAFILDQSKFTLASHESYGLESPDNALYRLNGVLPSETSGRFQIGMHFLFSASSLRGESAISKHASCFARLDVNNKRVIERKIRFNVGRKNNELITGDVMVEKGIHPISVLLYCDEDSYFLGQDVQISMSFREPGSQSFKKSSESIFHLYQRSRS